MFGHANTRCTCLVVGRYAAKPRKTSTCAHQPTPRRPRAAAVERDESARATRELNGWKGERSTPARCRTRTVAPTRRKNVV
jgi:hypothetical protein